MLLEPSILDASQSPAVLIVSLLLCSRTGKRNGTNTSTPTETVLAEAFGKTNTEDVHCVSGG
ncbi:MAG TPA: hypothetical protein PK453_11295 [Leptospiraceae bacterium]|nr:hypothetical protein [Leptospiraceae bacterium]HMY65878.1 hypothetical protein [Leptospiraceae bacterium]HNF14247.1 hypothetical protein [Leptospiraceae bacterium]HNF24651.1 hypothetical protein [Leptospiraceae bacterium]HNM03500.1 hypothetical protein [Leptospiraceae bacterium]